MAWYDLAQNPEALRSLYPGSPELSSISLFAVELDREGPAVSLRFDLDRFPGVPPARWRGQPFNRAQATVQFFDVADCVITRWSRDNPCRLEIAAAGDRQRVRVAGAGCDLAFTSGTFRIARVSGYADAGG